MVESFVAARGDGVEVVGDELSGERETDQLFPLFDQPVSSSAEAVCTAMAKTKNKKRTVEVLSRGKEFMATTKTSYLPTSAALVNAFFSLQFLGLEKR